MDMSTLVAVLVAKLQKYSESNRYNHTFLILLGKKNKINDGILCFLVIFAPHSPTTNKGNK